MRVARRPSAGAFNAGMPDEASVQYSELFSIPAADGRPGFRRVERPGTGLVMIAARHAALTPQEARAISRFRLHHYVLAGLYDGMTVQRLEVTTDPAMELLAAEDMHVAVGDTSGRFLCYLSMQSPLLTATQSQVGRIARDQGHVVSLGDTERAYFPCESEYGLRVFGCHPGLRTLPLARVRELTRLVRAQDTRERRVALALIETVVGMVRALLAPDGNIAAIIGSSVAEARRLLYGLGMPMAYAPLAPIVGDNEGGALPGSELLWTGESHTPGRFWPFALLTRDLADERDYLDLLDAALDLPEGQALREVGRIRRRGPRATSHLVVAPELTCGTLWTGDPFFAEAR